VERPVRAVWFPTARAVELRTERLPEPGPDQVCVEAIASAISHGTEMLVFRGQIPSATELDLPTLQGSFEFPIKYGYASVGHVASRGANVRELAVGDAVFVLHPHQSAYVVPATMPVRLPAGLDPVLGVFLANVETAVNVVLDAAPRIGERIAVFGQGVVGLLITQLLRRTGVQHVTVVDPVARRRELALRFGADAALKPDEPLGEVDLAIEASGSTTHSTVRSSAWLSAAPSWSARGMARSPSH
jgi:2-desacetyl-2-hydroxyethyl bacteriochlorophyllide A dehydrogenase